MSAARREPRVANFVDRESESDGYREEPEAASRGLRVRWLLAGIVALVVAGSPWWSPLILRRMDFFRVRRVEIVGAHYVAPSDILSRLNVDTTASVWDPTHPLAARVATYSEIQTAIVRRKLPGTLVVEVTERVPVALVPANGGFRVYDERGLLLPIDPARVTVDAPVLMQRDTALLRLLGAVRAGMPDLYARVSSVRRSGRDELVLQLKSVPVRTMQDVTLDRLADIDPVIADLARRQARVTEIDLRYRDQVIARLQ
ncbi:MAG: cell division protein FtsQ/DivIB [Gemmatimonadaceae bacterium]